ncbi:MAG: hypothetical protein V4497_01215 [Bacteroidota bacterium]
MSLNKAKLIDDLRAVLTNEQTEEVDANESLDRIVKGIATAVDVFVKSGTVSVTVATTGTATSHTGTGTGKIT